MNKKLLAVLISTSVVLGAHSVSSASDIEVREPKVEDGVTADTSTEPEMTFEELTEGEDLPSEGSFEAETSNEEETIDNEEIESPVDAMADENFAEITENSEIDSTNGDEDAIIDKVVIELEKVGINPYPWKDGENLEFENRAIKDGTVVEITDGNTTRVFDLKEADARTVKEFANKLNIDNIIISIKEPSDDGKTYHTKTYTKSEAIETPEDDTTENRKLTLTQLYNRDLKVIDQDGNTISLDTNAMVYWDANTAESIKLEDGELKYISPGKLGSNNEGKIYVDGRPLGIGSIVKSGDTEYEVINFSSDAVNGTTIQFKEYEAKPEDKITTETEIEKREIPFVVTEIKRDDLPEGYREVVRDGFNGYHIVRVTRTFVNGVEDKSKRTSEIVVTRPAEEEIVLVGTKKEEGTPLTPLEPSEDATTVDYKFEYTEFEEERIANPELAVGEERIIQVGSAGYTLYKLVLDGNGKEISREKVAERMAQNHIVEYGTKEVEDDKCEFPLIPLTPAEEIEEDKCEYPLIPLTPAKPIEDDKCEYPLIPLTPAKPIEKPVKPIAPIVDRPAYPVRPIVDAPILIDPIVEDEIDQEEDQRPDTSVADIIKELEDQSKEISDLIEKGQKDQVVDIKEDKKEENKKPAKEDNKEVKEDKKDAKNDDKKDDSDKAAVKVPAAEKKGEKAPAKKSSNPKTGVAGSSAVLATLMAAATGLFASKKRK